MGNYNTEPVLNGQAVVGYESVNGTGQVYFLAEHLCFLSNAEARELGMALIVMAYKSVERAQEIEERLYAPRDI